MTALSYSASGEPSYAPRLCGDAPTSLATRCDAGQATIVSDPETDRRFLLIPLPPAGVDSTSDSVPIDSNPDDIAAVASQIWQQGVEPGQLVVERDALADQIGQNFEELHWLHLLANIVAASHPTAAIQSVAHDVLPDLAELIRAESVVFIFDDGTDDIAGSGSTASSIRSVTAGKPIGPGEVSRLLEYVHYKSPDGPFVSNRDSHPASAPPQVSARNVAAVPIIQNKTRYGWLIALNRVLPFQPSGQPQNVSSAEFGTQEVGLLTTAASMLAGHARNIELFRAEESLRVNVIETITEALDARDPNTCGHSRRVGKYAVRIAEQIGYSAEKCEELYVAGLLHDVGKIGIPDDILKKTDRLTDQEFEVIKQHPEIGHSILTPLKGLAYVLPGVLHHHERIDGRGYPHGLAGDAIPLDARILAVADSFDAMTTNRTYRDGMEMSEAISILQAGAGQQWETEVVTTFVSIQQSIEN